MPDISFSGIPWSQPNPAYIAPDFGQMLGSQIGGYTPQGIGSSTVPSPAAGISSQIQGLIGSLSGQGQGAIGAAQGTSNQLQGLSGQLQGLAGSLNGAFAGDLGYAQQALQTGFDPMKTQEAYYQNQTLNATAGALANQGLAGTPAGAEATGAADAAFNNAWAMAASQRQQLGAQTATSLQNQYESGQLGAGSLISAAGQLDQEALSGILQAYGLQGQDLNNATTAALQLLSSYGVSMTNGGAAMAQQEGTGGTFASSQNSTPIPSVIG